MMTPNAAANLIDTLYGSCEPLLPATLEATIKQIQLDAFKAGMTYCTALESGKVNYPSPFEHPLDFWIQFDKAILTERDQLKEIPE